VVLRGQPWSGGWDEGAARAALSCEADDVAQWLELQRAAPAWWLTMPSSGLLLLRRASRFLLGPDQFLILPPSALAAPDGRP